LWGTDDGGFGVVASLDEDVGAEGLDEVQGGVFFEGDDAVYEEEAGQELHASGQGHDGPAVTFESLYAVVGVDAYDQALTQSGSLGEIGEVSGVDEVEDAVGENGRLAYYPPAAASSTELGEGKEFILN
jgi:hypothetical protein